MGREILMANLKSMDSKKLFDELEKKARLVVKEHGEHMPMFILPAAEPELSGARKVGILPVMGLMNDEEGKQKVVGLVRKIVEEEGLFEYYSVMDGWRLTDKKMKELDRLGVPKETRRPSQYPEKDRTSVIIMTHYHKIHGMTMRMFRYVQKKDGSWSCGKTIESDGSMYNKFNAFGSPQQIDLTNIE
jgi:hypothetical protein